ncbi:MAG TPA: PLP-dependent aspartate aminotransferase family protein [Blastocatellia bacterium]|nr:PLP-dependent aspartate aminotransferase family protein [Blastocatellia bacterium]
MEKRVETLAVHGGEEEKHASNSVAPPIFQTAIFSMDRFADLRRYGKGEAPELYLYVRGDNPTRDVAARKIAALEGAEDGLVTASGTAASFVIAISLLEAGDEIVSMETVYGGTYRMMRDVLPRLGIRTRFLEGDDLELLPSLASERTRMLWIESPTNPLNRVVDIRRAALLARERGLVSVIDNTFASPVNQRPVSLGIDLVMHSATKYLAGHGDVLAGAVCGRADIIARVRKTLVSTGAVLDPSAAAMLIRGMKTLDVRVERINANAQKLAEFFEAHPKIARVYYPGLESSPDREIARKQMTGFGGVVSIDLAEGTEAAAERLADALRLIKISTSLGGTETIVTYPIYTSHSGYSDEELARAGVGRGTLRFSVGIEADRDLIEDVARALDAV